MGEQVKCDEIRELIRKDDPYVLTLIYDLLGQKLFGYVIGMVNSRPDAEDIVQDLFIKIAEQRNKIAMAKNISAYIFRMASNLAMDCLRKRQKEKKMLFEGDFLLVKAESGNREEYEKDLNRLQVAVAGLSPEQKNVVFMHYFQGMTFEEIAELLDTSINTVASRCRYGLEKLKRAMGINQKSDRKPTPAHGHPSSGGDLRGSVIMNGAPLLGGVRDLSPRSGCAKGEAGGGSEADETDSYK